MDIPERLINTKERFVAEGDFITFKHTILNEYKGALEKYTNGSTSYENDIIMLTDFYINTVDENKNLISTNDYKEVCEHIKKMKLRRKIIRF
ncbi:hypothetical protein [Alteromonas gilva]|uniref:Uncharacterized protein n=1 Tax=Alteromonas gilva TaxID=2987522 RepID=A0ABT5L7W6_9ALTE|nr:hypothetical protein [Alteromonas gilva]MDC8832982.1 hypothetical protein [Alteromonas gilva]